MSYVAKCDIIPQEPTVTVRCSTDGCRLHPEATRERVRQHVQTSGHEVTVTVTTAKVYRPRSST